MPWPMSSIYACAGLGAAAGLALGIAVVLVRGARSEQIAALRQRMNFQFVRDVAREQISRYDRLSLFDGRHWHEAQNLMSGTTDYYCDLNRIAQERTRTDQRNQQTG